MQRDLTEIKELAADMRRADQRLQQSSPNQIRES